MANAEWRHLVVLGRRSFPPGYVRGDSARAHVKHKREHYAEYRNNQHGLLKASGAESFRDGG